MLRRSKRSKVTDYSRFKNMFIFTPQYPGGVLIGEDGKPHPEITTSLDEDIEILESLENITNSDLQNMTKEEREITQRNLELCQREKLEESEPSDDDPMEDIESDAEYLPHESEEELEEYEDSEDEEEDEGDEDDNIK